jgi:hypothetical protein
MKGLYSCSTPSKIRTSLSGVCCIKTGVFRKIMSCRIIISYWRIQTHHDCSSRRQFSIGQQKVNIPKYLKSSATRLWNHQTSHYSIIYCVYPSTWWFIKVTQCSHSWQKYKGFIYWCKQTCSPWKLLLDQQRYIFLTSRLSKKMSAVNSFTST